MSQVNSKTLQLSILAAAMLSLSACSTTPTIAGVDLGQVGSGLSKVGSKTKEVSSNAWEGTKNLLNIGPNEPELLDEVDLALMENDANLSSSQLASTDVEPLLPQDEVEAAWSDSLEDQPLLPQANAQQNEAVFGEVPAQTELVSELENNDTLVDDELLTADTQVMPTATVATNDLTHQVTENETLWDIAKQTTGDANNWHVIADINDLHPNASVFVGQKIVIPADMLKPVEAESVAVAQITAKSLDVEQPVMPEQPAAVALTIPEKNTDEAVIVATAEQIQPVAPADAANIMTDATALKVGAGETLWDFAKRTTGDATNWKQIADKNLFDEKQLAKIRPGQKIYVPTDMVRSRDANGVLIAKGAEGTVGGAMPEDQEAIAATAAVLSGTNQPDGQVKIVEAAFQDNKDITPVTAESLSDEAAMAVAQNDSESTKVMVSGTYYPKAVYNQADFSSSLLMRVSPGTQLQVSKAIGPWLEVKTDKGIGYVHSRDIK